MKRIIVNSVIKDHTATFLQTAEESNGKITDLDIILKHCIVSE